jgi:hypothetical protein
MKKKNPLFVVTNKGKDVEQATDFLDVLIKKFNLAPVIEILKVFMTMLSENVKNYPMFLVVKNQFDKFMALLTPFLSAMGIA